MKLFSLFTLLLLSAVALAQPGGLDKTYNADFGIGSAIGTSDQVFAAVRQSDNSIVATGLFTSAEGTATHVVRYKPDGTVDTSYGPVTVGGYNYQMAIQPDNKVIIVGEIAGGNIVRLNTDGTVDQEFKTNVGTGATDGTQGSSLVYALTLQDDGKILLGGLFTKFNGITRTRIVRLNSNGTVDNTFTPGEGTDWVVSAIGIQSTGKIVIAGTFTKYDGTNRSGLARLNNDGTLDASFNPNSFSPGHGLINRMLITSNDNIIMGGSFQQYGGVERYQLVKTDASGNLVAGFLSPINYGGSVSDIAFHPNDQIVVGGGFSLPAKGIVRLNVADGSVDNTFKPYNIETQSSGVQAIVVQDDGMIFIGGDFTKANGTTRKYLARLMPNGDLEGGRGADNTINTSLLLPDGNQMIAGDFAGYRGVARGRIAMVNTNGTINPNFNPAQGANGAIHTMGRDANGKFIIAGNFTTYRGTTRTRIARINSDGTLDNTFDPGAGANAIIRTVAIQADGAIVIGGDFTTYDGANVNRIARIETDGDPDTTFVPGDGADGNVQNLAILSTGKIVAVGNFSNYAGTSRKRITRINTNGSLDTSFDPGTGADAPIYVVKADNQDNLLIGGAFTEFNGVSRKGIARLTPTGAPDTSFDSGTTDYSTVRTITITASGNIFIGGDFAKKIALLSATGVADINYYPEVNPDNIVLTSVEHDGKIIAGGQFTMYDNVNVDRLARINSSGKRVQSITFAALPDREFGSGNFDLTATSSAGLPVAFASSNPNVATIAGKVVTIVGAGTTTITASQAGNDLYNAATNVERTLTIAKGSQTITFSLVPVLEDALVGDTHNLTGTTTSGLPITYTSTQTDVATVSGNVLTVVSAGQTLIRANQAGNANYEAALQAEQGLTIIALVVGLENEDAGIVAYPNPTEGVLTVQLPLSHTGAAKATLLNTSGVRVGDSQQAGRDLQLDLSALPKGIYLVRVQSGGVNSVKRVLKK